MTSGPLKPPRGQAILPGLAPDPPAPGGQRLLPGMAGLTGAQHVPTRVGASTARGDRTAADADPELDRVAAELLAIDPDGSRIGTAVRGALDMLLDGQHTGRYRWDQLCKTENLIPNRGPAGQDGITSQSASWNDTRSPASRRQGGQRTRRWRGSVHPPCDTYAEYAMTDPIATGDTALMPRTCQTTRNADCAWIPHVPPWPKTRAQ